MKRGRKSAADLSVARPENAGSVESLAPPPKELKPEAQALWRQIVASRPAAFYGPGDLPLLREYCHTTATLLPRVNSTLEADADTRLLDARDKLCRLAASLAGKLRICVSSRTRPDVASMRDSVAVGPTNKPWGDACGKPWE